MTYKMNVLTYRLGREPIPSDSETDRSDSDSETDSETKRIAEQYPYTDCEDED